MATTEAAAEASSNLCEVVNASAPVTNNIDSPERKDVVDGPCLLVEGSSADSGTPLCVIPPITSPRAEAATGAEAIAGAGSSGVEGGNFECNICLELAQDPVVTLCGHLFCWPCLYNWLQIHTVSKECPVCKAGVTEEKVIPLYGRGNVGATDPRKKPVADIPNRPQGQRPEPIRHPNHHPAFNFMAGPTGPFATAQIGNFTLSAGFGLFPALFGLQFQTYPPPDGLAAGPQSPYPRPGQPAVAPDNQQQQFLSRLLLFLGSFVILCLLFF